MSKSEIGVVFGQSNNRKNLSTPFSFINQSISQSISTHGALTKLLHADQKILVWCYSISVYTLVLTQFSQWWLIFWINWLIDLTWALLSAPVHNWKLIVVFYCWNRLWLPESDTLWNHFLITLSTARCLYQVQWIPSTLYDSLYVLTLSSLLYRPCVATLVTAVISPRLICSHWFELLILGHQAAMCLPSVKRLSLASEGPCRVS